ncbi:DivIVA domain-containing protein [Brevibacterium jeotgali]|uniref:Cell wall synthesis protein Wag31 n=1 Tax=Brevibacterium jeotgali TaxID=1262550 RepID=A0A2H1L759_9MICO|nr:DivIVA domain-containing protein [Brevibacterium jeotgali]TWC02660.1 DivIVA domain-containing protein [Brevibacterium jeotgali]SMY12570.1 DivIVA domain-containing protein [Brevibacterium jeotgali]
MALTPEDVVNKRFQHVKFRDGYDQDEVDDFLDEVVVELRRLYQENDELKQKLSAAESRAGETDSGAPAAPQASEDPQATQAMPAAVPAESAQAPAWGATPAEPEASAGPATPAEPEAPAEPAAPLVAPQESQAAVEEPQAEPAAPTQAPDASALSAAPSGNDSHGLIALAQRVHDEHVSEGERKRDELIAEAETRATSIVGDAEKKRDDTLTSLETQKSDLQREIDTLQNFERQYRTRLKSYLTDQLRDLENSGSLAPETLGDSAARRSI